MPLPSFCGCASLFEITLVENAKDRFSHDVAQMTEVLSFCAIVLCIEVFRCLMTSLVTISVHYLSFGILSIVRGDHSSKSRSGIPEVICMKQYLGLLGDIPTKLFNAYWRVIGHFVPRSFCTQVISYHFGHFVPTFIFSLVISYPLWSFRTHFIPSLVISYLLLLFSRKLFW